MNENIEYLVKKLRETEETLVKFSNELDTVRRENLAKHTQNQELASKLRDAERSIASRQKAWELQCGEQQRMVKAYDDLRNKWSAEQETVAKLQISFEEQKANYSAWVRRAEKAERQVQDFLDLLDATFDFFAVPDYGPAKAFLLYRCPKSGAKPEIWNPVEKLWITTKFQSAQVLVKKFGTQLVESNAREVESVIEEL